MLNLEVTRSDNFVVAEEKNLAAMEQAIVRNIVLIDLPDVLNKEEKKGFDPDPEKYTLILRNRGRESKRQLKTLPSSIPYIKLGVARQPVSFTFTQKGAQNWREVLLALDDAMYMLMKRYGRIMDTGNYGRNTMFFAREGSIYTFTPQRINQRTMELKEGDAVGIMPLVPYAAWVEAYHGASNRRWHDKKGRRKNMERPKRIGGGIVRPIAMAIARKYPNIAVRYEYETESYGPRWYNTPMILLAPKGTFTNAFVPIGRKKLRRY